jgi:hypothetical protein
MRRFWLFAICLLIPAMAMSQPTDGAVVVRIPDGVTSTCVTPRHQVYLTLRRLITTRNVGWLREDQSVGLLINAAVLSGDKRVNFPLASQVNVRQYVAGQVSIPVEYSVVSGLPLTQDKTVYKGVQLDLTLLNMQSKTGWGKTLEALVEVSKNLPIPSTPLVTASSYLLDFANNAVQKEVDAHNANDKARSATLAMNFDPTGQCPAGQDWERTGTLAVLQGVGTAGPGLIGIDVTNNYCWAADLKPTFALKAARKDPAKSCTATDYRPTFIPVTNNYVAFFLNAILVGRTLGPVDAEQRDALARCAAHGVDAMTCIPQ